MVIANTSETRFAYVVESTFGQAPATPAFVKTKYTGTDIRFTPIDEISEVITSTAEIDDYIRTGGEVRGPIDGEMYFGSEIDTLFEHAFRGTFAANILDGGLEKKSITIENTFETGVTDHFFRFNGCRVNSFSLNVEATRVLRSQFGIMGVSHPVPATSIISGATYAEPTANPSMSAKDVAAIAVGGASGTIRYAQITLNLTNNCFLQPEIGNDQAFGVGYGRREVTGTLRGYMENIELYDLMVQNTLSSISFETSDGTNMYTWTLPKVRFRAAGTPVRGNSNDVFVEMTYGARNDPGGINTSIRVEKA